ncbi:capsular biosynthesis protein [Bacillus toyonensis]|uniref:polysaccharide biosynthesis C-terminal domain-containing protein n=1 Tax=Bacillus toyonensis TaxID=155322 RepID=UPI000BFBD587|nr:NAD-dependent epimerase/dehydratase family protein [Bacillus toyonensis]PHC35527.1 capsular biosynthesis protein [Bacillus toyonensis]
MKILVTGSEGFVGKNLVDRLSKIDNIEILCFTKGCSLSVLNDYLKQVEGIYHLAGVNRPQSESEFQEGNVELTKYIVDNLLKSDNKPWIVFSSSVQVELENPYGRSKKQAEDLLHSYHFETGASVNIYRLPNLFGKWCKPNYNSVVATFCHNIARGKAISIHDPEKYLELLYIDDLIDKFINLLQDGFNKEIYPQIDRIYEISLKDLAEKINGFYNIRKTHTIPDLSDVFTKKLHATYLSYLEKNDFSYELEMKRDNRGFLAEIIKSNEFGQIFISSTKEDITRGNHYHHTKVEKFCVIKGEAEINFRDIYSESSFSYIISEEKLEIVDIPPGYTHNIKNIGLGEMLVLFWANEIFNSEKADTFYLEV